MVVVLTLPTGGFPACPGKDFQSLCPGRPSTLGWSCSGLATTWFHHRTGWVLKYRSLNSQPKEMPIRDWLCMVLFTWTLIICGRLAFWTFGTAPRKTEHSQTNGSCFGPGLQTVGGPREWSLPNVSLHGEMRQQVLSNLDPWRRFDAGRCLHHCQGGRSRNECHLVAVVSLFGPSKVCHMIIIHNHGIPSEYPKYVPMLGSQMG